MSLCPEFEYRQTLSDEDFWIHIFGEGPTYNDDDRPDLDEPYTTSDPCPICYSIEACGYDNEGRPMIHSLDVNDD
jgi:hypothetical protein